MNVTDSVGKQSNGFDALFKVLKGGLTFAITPIKAAFYGIKLVIEEAQLAWEDSFFGDKDQQKIDALNNKILDTKKNLKETAENVLQAGKDIVNNFGDAVGQVSDVISGVVDKASKMNVSAIYEQSKAMVAMKNNAKIAAAQLQGLVEQYDRMAEQQRQIRDDETLSIDERIKANNKLGEVLKEQQAAMLKLADARISAAAAELSTNKSSVELQAAYIEATNERKAILAQIAGFESEQKVNAIALDKEKLELSKAVSNSEASIAASRKAATINLIQDELERTKQLLAQLDLERETERVRLQGIVNSTKEGTQARADAQIALNEKMAEYANNELVLNDSVNKIKLQREKDINAQRLENESAFITLKKTLLDAEKLSAFERTQRQIELGKAEYAAQKMINDEKMNAEIAAAEKVGLETTLIKQKYAIQNDIINAGIAKSERELAAAKKAATFEAADALESTLSNVSKAMGEQTGAGKAFAVAAATISTISSAQKAYDATVGIPYIGPFLAPINAGLAIAAGIKNVRSILAVKIPNVSSGGGSAPSISTPAAPVTPQAQRTVIDQTSVNAIGNAANGGTGRAYVLNSDINNNAERNAALHRAASIG